MAKKARTLSWTCNLKLANGLSG
uniref:Uncharacterized protein n=1 Tax=Arundo donax TaxID=35708 RepID=A0A0A9FJK2_ARUDO